MVPQSADQATQAAFGSQTAQPLTVSLDASGCLVSASPALLARFSLESRAIQSQSFASLFMLEDAGQRVLAPEALQAYVAYPVRLRCREARPLIGTARLLPLHSNQTDGPVLLLFEEQQDPALELSHFYSLFERAARLFDTTPEGLVDRLASEFGSPPEVIERWRELLARSSAAGSPVSMEFSRSLTDGASVWLKLIGAALSPEEQIRLSEATLKSFFDNAPMMLGIIELLPDGDVLMIASNKQVADMLGTTPAQLDGRRLSGLGMPEDLVRVWVSVLLEAEAHQGPAGFEFPLSLGPGADPLWIRYVVAPISPSQRRFSFVAEDITVSKQAAARLKDSETRFRGIFNTMSTYIGLLDPAGEYLEISQGLLDFAGVSRTDIIGRPVWEAPWWRSESDRDELRQALARAAAGEFVGYETEYLGAGDQVIAVDFSLSPIVAEDGLVRYLIPEARDITGLKRQQQALERSNQELQNFAYVASHDLQEPLRKIQAFGSRLSSLTLDPASQEADYLRRMLNAAARMQLLINDLISYSRLTTRTRELEPVDLGRVLSETREVLELRIEETGAVIHADDLPVIEADPQQMRQLFQNLLGNSLKYVHPERTPEIRIRADLPRPRELRLRFEDNGIGFEAHYCEKIFQIFQRLHGRSSAYSGSGIGLSICRRIVERHGGSITAEGVPGVGACFEIILPQKPPAASPEPMLRHGDGP